jgi:hypothetical protein
MGVSQTDSTLARVLSQSVTLVFCLNLILVSHTGAYPMSMLCGYDTRFNEAGCTFGAVEGRIYLWCTLAVAS